MEKIYCVYILTNQRNTVLYTGITGDLRARIHHHREKLLPGFTNRYNVSKLVCYEAGADASGAIAQGEANKGWVASEEDRAHQSAQSRMARSARGPITRLPRLRGSSHRVLAMRGTGEVLCAEIRLRSISVERRR